MTEQATRGIPDPRILSDERVKDLKQQYETPPELFEWCCDVVRQFGIYGITLDVAASQKNKKCFAYIAAKKEHGYLGCIGENSLVCPWVDHHVKHSSIHAAWCNPPFGMTKLFMPRAHNQALEGVFSAVLTQTDTSVLWWLEAMAHATARIDIHPRVQFIQHPDLVTHYEAIGKKLSGNPGGNTLWVFNPYDIDRPGGARIVQAEPWR